MRKMTITENRQLALKQNAACFLRTLDQDNVKDIKLTGNDLSAGAKISNTGRKPISSTKSNVRAVADISLLNDQELAQLREELAAEKKRIKELIASEQNRAQEIKHSLQEEVAPLLGRLEIEHLQKLKKST